MTALTRRGFLGALTAAGAMVAAQPATALVSRERGRFV